jgi:hypothetical protein
LVVPIENNLSERWYLCLYDAEHRKLDFAAGNKFKVHGRRRGSMVSVDSIRYLGNRAEDDACANGTCEECNAAMAGEDADNAIASAERLVAELTAAGTPLDLAIEMAERMTGAKYETLPNSAPSA